MSPALDVLKSSMRMELSILSSANSSNGVIDKPETSVSNNPLRLISTGSDPEPNPATSQPSVFSSIKQTAVALVTVASNQATQRARRTPKKTGVRDLVSERMEFAVQRANADQARRVADCLHVAFDAFVNHVEQPCIALDSTCQITRWNPAMAVWSGIDEDAAIGQPLSAILTPESAARLDAANAALREAEETLGSPDGDPVFVLDGVFTVGESKTARRVSLVPLCRIPRVVEKVVVLFSPAQQSESVKSAEWILNDRESLQNDR